MRPRHILIPTLLTFGFAAAAIAAGPTPQTMQQSPAGAGAGSLFPNDQPAPPYAVSGANNEQAGLTKGSEPNAGHTGLNGSGGTSNGWPPVQYNGSAAR
jgi:hypothetical protein